MNYHNLTKDQLIEELLKLHEDYDILKKSFLRVSAGHKQPVNKITKTNKTTDDYNRRLINIVEHERAMIAMNLHDDIGQKLTALSLNILWLKSRIGVQSKVVTEKLEEINMMIKETIDGVQDFSSNLRPAILFDLGPASAFISFLKKFEDQSGIKCHFYNELQEFKIGNNISLVLYRILQEVFTNIARHSKATTAEVILRKVKNKIKFIIKDNGIGIEIAGTKSSRSMGITGIKKRVELVNGKVLIKGEKNVGTTITVTVPVKNIEQND
jgi:signal transduction histidine kinase